MKQTAKEYAEELYIEFYPTWLDNGMVAKKKYGKELAIKAVNRMIIQNGELYLNGLGEKTIEFYTKKNAFLFEVKAEIEAL